MNSCNKIRIGVIADDFTGGSDAASFLAANGLRTILYNGIPASLPQECEGIVIALKTRSINPKEAIQQTMEAVEWLKAQGVETLYFKYCSTFDSTAKGNIGPVLDYLLEETGQSYTVLCPSLPANGRKVKDGILYVNGTPLAESPLKDHPLNPMWDSRISELMREQSKYPCLVVRREEMKSRRAVMGRIAEFQLKNPRFYVVPDYENDLDGEQIAACFGELHLISGGSGLLKHLSQIYDNTVIEEMENRAEARAVILCGSCSAATQAQIQDYRDKGGICYGVDSKKLLDGSLKVADIWRFIRENSAKKILVYSDAVEKDRSNLVLQDSFHQESKLIEETMAELSRLAEKDGMDRIVVAGGETSGAVMLALGYDAYFIGESIAVGVPEMMPVNNRDLTIVLKSGNFGQVDFFERAVSR